MGCIEVIPTHMGVWNSILSIFSMFWCSICTRSAPDRRPAPSMKKERRPAPLSLRTSDLCWRQLVTRILIRLSTIGIDPTRCSHRGILSLLRKCLLLNTGSIASVVSRSGGWKFQYCPFRLDFLVDLHQNCTKILTGKGGSSLYQLRSILGVIFNLSKYGGSNLNSKITAEEVAQQFAR